MLDKYNDFIIDLILEKILNKEIPLILSQRFLDLLDIIEHPIKSRFKEVFAEDIYTYKVSFIDLDDSGLDKVSFTTTPKVVDLYSEFFGNVGDINLDLDDVTSFHHRGELSKKVFSKNRSVTTIGKLVNKLFKGEFPANGKPGEDIESFVNLFKSSRETSTFELVDGADIIYWYGGEQYAEDEGPLGGSCMKDEDCEGYLEFYANNSNKVSLLILKDKDDNTKIRGRALVWKLDYPDRTFMDRVYYTSDFYIEQFKTYAKEQGWLHKIKQNMNNGEEIVDTKTGEKSYMDFVVNNMHESDGGFPYMDTMKYYDSDSSTLSNNKGQMSGEYYLLEDTAGGYEEETTGEYYEYYDEYLDPDEMIYCELGDDYRKDEDAHWIDFYQQHTTEEYADDHMTDCDYADGYGGYETYREWNDTTTVYGSDESACTEYAEKNLEYSDYHNSYLPEGDGVWSDHHNTSLYKPEATEVWIDAEQTETDWRDDDDGTWHIINDEQYDENVSEDDFENDDDE